MPGRYETPRTTGSVLKTTTWGALITLSGAILVGRTPRKQPVGSWSPLCSSSGAGPAVRGQWACVLLRRLASPPLRLDQHVHCVRPSIPEI